MLTALAQRIVNSPVPFASSPTSLPTLGFSRPDPQLRSENKQEERWGRKSSQYYHVATAAKKVTWVCCRINRGIAGNIVNLYWIPCPDAAAMVRNGVPRVRRSSNIEPVAESRMLITGGFNNDTPGLQTLFDQLVLVDDASGKDHKGGCEQGAAEVEKQCVPE